MPALQPPDPDIHDAADGAGGPSVLIIGPGGHDRTNGAFLDFLVQLK